MQMTWCFITAFCAVIAPSFAVAVGNTFFECELRSAITLEVNGDIYKIPRGTKFNHSRGDNFLGVHLDDQLLALDHLYIAHSITLPVLFGYIAPGSAAVSEHGTEVLYDRFANGFDNIANLDREHLETMQINCISVSGLY